MCLGFRAYGVGTSDLSCRRDGKNSISSGHRAPQDGIHLKSSQEKTDSRR